MLTLKLVHCTHFIGNNWATIGWVFEKDLFCQDPCLTYCVFVCFPRSPLICSAIPPLVVVCHVFRVFSSATLSTPPVFTPLVHSCRGSSRWSTGRHSWWLSILISWQHISPVPADLGSQSSELVDWGTSLWVTCCSFRSPRRPRLQCRATGHHTVSQLGPLYWTVSTFNKTTQNPRFVVAVGSCIPPHCDTRVL